jgi:anti-sigma regulatory factor (Ser/Thr protein kinase)
MPRQRRAAARLLAEFSIPSQPGNERIAMRQVAEAVRSLGLAADRLERLETAVSEAALNAMEHGNHFEPDRPVKVRVVASAAELCVTLADQGGGSLITAREEPDLDAKLAGLQSPRGWGLFLIRTMVDEMSDEAVDGVHKIHLRLKLK